MSTVNIDQIKNESDMINLSQDQLRIYANTVSSYVSIEESTIKGLELEQIYYEGLEQGVDTEISILTDAINISSYQLSQLIAQESTLVTQSTLTQAQIQSTIKAIEEQQSTIDGTGGEISSLTKQKKDLEGQIIIKDNAFNSAAATYAIKYSAYTDAVDEYNNLLAKIDNICTLLISSTKVAEKSQKVWEGSASTLASYDRQMSTLKQQEAEYVLKEIDIGKDLDDNMRYIISTYASVQNWSSFLTTALMNKKYIDLVSSLQADLKEASDATEVYNRYFQRFMSQMGGADEVVPIVDTPMTNAELSTMVFEQKKKMDILKARVAQGQIDVNNASTTLESAAMSSFEVALAGYDAQLAFEYSTLYHYRELGRKAREQDIPYYTALRNSTYTAALKALSSSKMYGDAYISTFIGYYEMLDAKFILEGQVLSNADDAYYESKNLIDYITGLCGRDYLPIPAIRNLVNTYSDTNLNIYNGKRLGWLPGTYMSSLAAEQASVAPPVIEFIDITEPIATGPNILNSTLQSIVSSCSEQFLSPQISSLLARGDISSLMKQVEITSTLTAKGDYSSITLLSATCAPLTSYYTKQSGAQFGGGQSGGQIPSIEDEEIDERLANEIFDMTYLLYSQGTPDVPSSLTLNISSMKKVTVSFVTPPAYIPRSVSAFGPMGGDISSFAGWSAISTQKAKDYDAAMGLVYLYNERYVSVSNSLSTFTLQLAGTLSNIKQLGYESTLAKENINKLNIRLAKEGVELLNAFNTQERATYEYRESYVREIRVKVQNNYEDAIKNEIARQSSIEGNKYLAKGDTSSIVDYLKLISLDSGDIGSNYSKFQDLSSTLRNFSNLYQRYDNRGLELSNYTSNSSDYMTINSNFSELLMSNILYPGDTDTITLMGIKYVSLSNAKVKLDQIQSNFEPLTAAINEKKPVVYSNYVKTITDNQYLLSNITVESIESEISTFLSNAYVEGYNTYVA